MQPVSLLSAKSCKSQVVVSQGDLFESVGVRLVRSPFVVLAMPENWQLSIKHVRGVDLFLGACLVRNGSH